MYEILRSLNGLGCLIVVVLFLWSICFRRDDGSFLEWLPVEIFAFAWFSVGLAECVFAPVDLGWFVGAVNGFGVAVFARSLVERYIAWHRAPYGDQWHSPWSDQLRWPRRG